MKPERISRKTVYQSPWVNLYLDKVKMPAGRVIDEYHLLDFDTEGVAAVIENDQQEILFVHAYRYPTDSIEWEVPAGGIDSGESVIEAAKREVYEETGYEAGKLEHVYTYNPSNGNSTQVFHVVFGKTVRKISPEYDRNEIEALRWIPIAEIRRMIQNREIYAGYTLTALLLYLTQMAT